MKKHRKTIVFALFALLILLLLPRLSTLTAADILSYTPASLPLAALILLGIYSVKGVVVFIPVAALYVCGGILFPTGWAVLVTYLGLACELSVGYWMGRSMGGDKARALVNENEKARRFLTSDGGHGPATCFLARILPIPMDLVSLFFGATRFPYLRFLLFSLLGVSPGMLPFVLAGGNIANPLSREFLLPFGVGMAVAACAFLLCQGWQRKKDAAG